MTILFIIVNMLMIAFLSWKGWKRSAISDPLTYWSALSLRLLAGISVGLVYKYHYSSGDTWVLFDNACKLTDLFYADWTSYLEAVFTGNLPETITGEDRSLFFISIISVVNIITHNNYWLTSLWLSALSFWCCYRLVVKLTAVFPSSMIAGRIALLFWPSVVFWTSGIIKETVAFAALVIIVIHFLSAMRDKKTGWASFAEIIISLYVLVTLKYYWAAVLLPCMITAFIVRGMFKKREAKTWLIAVSWLIVFMAFSILTSFTHPNFYLGRLPGVIVENHDAVVAISRPDNLIHYNDLSSAWPSIFLNSPWALFSGLFRPSIFNTSGLGYLEAIENLFLLILVIWKLLSLRMPSQENRTIVLTAIVFVIVLCIFLALSTPNLGTLSRYRVGFLSIFVLLILIDHPIFRFINGKPGNYIRS